MIEAAWFPTAAVVVACAMLVAVAGAALCAWPAPRQRVAMGAFLVLLFLYVVGGLGYALFTAPTSHAPMPDCIGPPSATCG